MPLDVVYEFGMSLRPDMSIPANVPGQNANDRGLFNPKFSSLGSLASGHYPDVGLQDGRFPALNYGERLSPEMAARMPNPLRFGGMGKKKDNYPEDLLTRTDGEIGYANFVSERFMDAVESLDPGLHQFIPTTAAKVATDEPLWASSRWYYFNILTWIGPDRLFKTEAMVDIPHQVQFIDAPDYTVGGRLVTGRKTVGYSPIVHKHIIRQEALSGALAGRHIWITSSYITDDLDRILCLPPLRYCSPTMKRAFQKAGLKGMGFAERPVA